MQYGLKLQWSENTLDDFHDIMFTFKYITQSCNIQLQSICDVKQQVLV